MWWHIKHFFHRSFRMITQSYFTVDMSYNRIIQHSANRTTRFILNAPRGAAFLSWPFFQDGRRLFLRQKSLLLDS